MHLESETRVPLGDKPGLVQKFIGWMVYRRRFATLRAESGLPAQPGAGKRLVSIWLWIVGGLVAFATIAGFVLQWWQAHKSDGVWFFGIN